MRIEPLELEGAYLIRPEEHMDERGSFFRTYCKKELKKLNVEDDFVQHNISQNNKKGTLRGLHFQRKPYEESKIVRCISGKVFDVLVDIRKNSSTYGKYLHLELSSENGLAVYIPEGFAHGFQTLTDDATLFYLMSESYQPEYACGIRWDDPVVNIKWPLGNKIISEKDKNLPSLIELELS